MKSSFQKRTLALQDRIGEQGMDLALLTDPDTIYYVSGFCNYIGMEFGRPTMIILPRAKPGTLITPDAEMEMARTMTWIEDIRGWMDGVNGEWALHLRDLLGPFKKLTIGVERSKITPVMLESFQSAVPAASFVDVSDIVSEMRMIKSPEEIKAMRQAGEVAIAMCEAGVNTIGEGVPEYEVALAVIAGGTRKAAEFHSPEGAERLFSPMIHNLQILQSGHDTTMAHSRPTVRKIQKGDPVFMCFCCIASFKHFKLGFDREYFVGSVKDEYARIYEIAIGDQEAALKTIRPGVAAEEVHKAACEVYRENGLGLDYRTGRGIGYSYLEEPQLKNGDKTLLERGMTFAVDGAVTIPGQFGARVGDSIVVTENGYEFLTPYPKDLRIL